VTVTAVNRVRLLLVAFCYGARVSGATGAWAAVEAMLDEAVGPVFPAAQLVVVDHGAIQLARAAGDATMATRFDLASLTKPLCTTALAIKLIARGQLALADRPRPESTVAQLLSHSGGLPAWRALADPTQPGEAMRERAIEAARREPLEYAPGARSIYSDLGFILLGDAIERASGERLDTLFGREIASPLEAAVGFGPIVGDDIAPTEGGLRGTVHDDNCRGMGGVAGHAGLFGDASAVSALVGAWVDAFHGGDAQLDPAWVRRAWLSAGVPGSSWGLGWDHPSATGSSAGERWPKSGVGHLAFTGCSVWVDPPRRRWVVLLSNRVHPTRNNEAIRAFRPRVHDAIYAALEEGPPIR
jgi:CubicO group peptidase (beta-lactamase class C family)